MRVCHGLTGETVDVDDQELQWRRPLDVVAQLTRDHWGLASEDIIVLIAGGGTLTSSALPGAAAEALCRDRDVFFFPKGRLDPSADGAAPKLNADSSSVDSAGVAFDPAAVSRETMLAELSTDPAFEAFRGNIADAARCLAGTRPIAALAAATERRSEVQRLAARAVLENLATQRGTCARSMELFSKKYGRVQKRVEQSLGKVEASMSELADVFLHSAMRAEGRETLADVVPRERVLRFTKTVESDRLRLAHRVDKLQHQDTQTQALCDEVVERVHQFLLDETVVLAAQEIRTQHQRAELELWPALCAVMPKAGAAPQAVLEEEKRSSNMLESLTRVCVGVGSLLEELQARWDRQYATSVQRLREVSYTQSKIRNVERQAALLEEEINVHNNYSQQLGHFQKMQQAYRKTIWEVARRRQFHARYVEHCERARNALSKMVDDENNLRRAFLHRYGCHLPADLVPGIGMFVPQASFEVPEFDIDLPDISLSSLQEVDLEEERGGGVSATRHERTLSTSSCSSSICNLPVGQVGVGAVTCSVARSAQISSAAGGGNVGGVCVGSSSLAKDGVGSATSSGSRSGTQLAPTPPIHRSAQGDELSTSALGGSSSSSSAAALRIRELEARNQSLQAKLDSLLAELPRSRVPSALSGSTRLPADVAGQVPGSESTTGPGANLS